MLELDYTSVLALLLLAVLAVTASLGRLLSFRLLSAARKSNNTVKSLKHGEVLPDILTRSIVRKVKVSKVGDYLILTVVLKTTVDTSTEVEIEEPLVLLSDGDIIAKNSAAEELSS
ncbi:MAG: hypothetical protein RMI56_03505 [Sulfolobales archaeon]|nr:hypothetical protein [Sulfolobales archaeon]MDW8082847.1 hypothetical protein [Sulfolobales archaeon]